MQIVIDIPEKVIKAIQNGKDYRYDIHTAIAQGTPLPKGHGDLIDTNELEPDTEWSNYEDGFISYSRNQIKCAKVIIEADAESEDKR